RQLDSAGHLAQHAGISLVRLDPSRSYPQAPHQRCWYHAHFVPALLCSFRHVESLRARLQDHPARRPLRQVAAQLSRRHTRLLDDLALLVPDADLGFPSSKVDANMLHGRTPSLVTCVSNAYTLRILRATSSRSSPAASSNLPFGRS